MKRILDPIHGFVELDAAELELLDAAPVQRLRRLRQLGLAHLVFPGAEHTRFTHALGALALGDRVLASLRAHDDAGYFESDADYAAQRRLLRASLLLHDVGHGPFSHACEAVLGVAHETRTRAILALPEIADALARLGVEGAEVLRLVTGDPLARHPVLRELVSGPNLDADRMDYLLRDGYFTGVANGRYDAAQLVASLRVVSDGGAPALGVDGRGTAALESFVLARYLMFSTVYFHHTTRQFERVLQTALRETWPDPRALDPVETFLAWDDFRVLESLRGSPTGAARAVRERRPPWSLVAEFNAERDLHAFESTFAALRGRFGTGVWADAQEQLVHRIPLGADGGPTVLVRTRLGVVDAREASDLIARVAGTAYWRKLYVAKDAADVAEARALCNVATSAAKRQPVQTLLEGIG